MECNSCVCPGSNIIGPDLIVNGNFSNGDSGFTSTLSNNNPPCTEGSYTVANDFPVLCNTWPAGVFDHTAMNSSGSFMMVDGAADTSQSPIIWSQSVNVVPGKTYCLSFWTASVYCADQQSFDLLIYMNSLVNPSAPTSVGIANPIIVEPCNPGQPFIPTWINHNFTWTCPNNFIGPYELIIQQGFANAFTDFGIDDICFSEVDGPVSTTSPDHIRSLLIYPNPNTGEFNVDLTELGNIVTSLRIISITGQLLSEIKVDKNNQLQKIDARNLPQGLYLLEVVSEGRILSANRFVKM